MNYNYYYNDSYSTYTENPLIGEKQIVWAVLMQSGLIGGYEEGNMYISPQVLAEKAKNFIGCPVDYNHNNNQIGVVLDVVFNDKGIETENGVVIPANYEWMAKFEIPKNIDISQKGVSTQYTPVKKKCENYEYNDVQCTYIVEDLTPRFLSVVDKKTARYNASEDIYNMGSENIDKNTKHQNNAVINNNIMEETKKEYSMEDVVNSIAELKMGMEDIKNLCSVKNSTEEETKETKEEVKKEDVKNEGEDKLDKILSLLEKLLEKETKEEVKEVVEEQTDITNSSNLKIKENKKQTNSNSSFLGYSF